MSYREWKRWLGELPWSLRWFVVLVLIRPALDLLYFLKSVSPFLSPLYIIGAATPMLIVASYFSRRFPRIRGTVPDLAFVLLAGLFLFNAAAVLTLGIDLATLEIVLKILTPILIYFFVRHLIRSRRDLHGLLTTFLYSTVIPIGMLLFESFVDPFDAGVVETRDFTRFNGLYADVVSYAIYVIGAFLIVAYFFVQSIDTPSFRRRSLQFGAVAIVAIVCLLNMHHASSWAVFAAVSLLLIAHASSLRLAPVLLVVCCVGAGGYFLFGTAVAERVSTMYETEVAIVENREDAERMFHGRGYRWKRMINDWQDEPATAKMLGVSITASVPDRVRLLSGTHNDYLRIGFGAGVVGLGLYLLVFLLLFQAALQHRRGEKFLILSAMAVVLLYSITTTPTLYAPLMYLCLSIFAYGVLGRRAGARL